MLICLKLANNTCDEFKGNFSICVRKYDTPTSNHIPKPELAIHKYIGVLSVALWADIVAFVHNP